MVSILYVPSVSHATAALVKLRVAKGSSAFRQPRPARPATAKAGNWSGVASRPREVDQQRGGASEPPGRILQTRPHDLGRVGAAEPGPRRGEAEWHGVGRDRADREKAGPGQSCLLMPSARPVRPGQGLWPALAPGSESGPCPASPGICYPCNLIPNTIFPGILFAN